MGFVVPLYLSIYLSNCPDCSQDLCDTISGFSTAQTTELGIARASYVDSHGNYPVLMKCFLQDVNTFYSSSATPLPLALADMQTIMQASPTVFTAGAYSATSFNGPASDATYYRFFEVGLLNWLNGGAASTFPSSAVSEYADLLGGVADSGAVRSGNTLTSAGMMIDDLADHNIMRYLVCIHFFSRR